MGILGLDDSHLQAPSEGRGVGTCLESSSQNEGGISGLKIRVAFPEYDYKQDPHCPPCLGLSTEEEYPLTTQRVREGGLR